MTNPFTRPGGTGGAPAKDNATFYHSFPLPPEMRQYNPDGDRDSYGRYRLPDPTGSKPGRKAFTRATTGAKVLDDTYNLNQWDIRQVITGIHSKPELLEAFPEFGDYQEQRQALEEIAEDARIAAGSKESSEFGTALHAWLEAVDGGHVTLEEVPVLFRPKVVAYLEECQEWGLTVPENSIERIVWHEDTGFVGTFDRVYHLHDGTPVIGDVKTSKDLKYSYLAISVQLATYADASAMLSLDGQSWEEMPVVDTQRAVVMWVPSNQDAKAEMVPINLEIGRAALALASEVKVARSPATAKLIRLDKSVIPHPKDPVKAGDDDLSIEDLILNTPNAEALAALYEEHAEFWTSEHTILGHKHLEAIQGLTQ